MEARRQTRERTRSQEGRFYRFFHGLLWTSLVVALIWLAGSTLLERHLNSEIRAFIHQRFADRYVGYDVRLRSVRCVEGKGIEVRGLTIAAPGQPAAVQIDEMLIHCGTALKDLVHRNPCIHQITLRRPHLRATRQTDGSWDITKLWPPPQCGNRPAPNFITDATLELRDATASDRVYSLRNIQLASETISTADAPLVNRVRGSASGDHFQKLEFAATQVPGQNDWSAEGSLSGLEFSDRLLGALPADWLAKAAPLAALQARGDFQFTASSQPADGFPCTFAVDGKLTEGRLSHARLPSPISDLTANLHCDNRGLRITDLAARDGDTTLELHCETFGFTDKSPFVLRARARQLTIDHRLLEVLPPALQTQWNKFSPSGTADLDAAVTFDGERWDPDLYLVAHNMSATYFKFPYPLTGIRGAIRLREGVLRSEELRADVHGQSLRMETEVHNPGPNWTGFMEVSLSELVPIDDEMLAALSGGHEKTAQVVRQLNPRGQLTAWGRFERHEPHEVIDKRLHIGIRDGSIRYAKFPYPLEQIRGTISLQENRWTFERLEGRNDNARVTCDGGWTPRSDGGLLRLTFAATDVPLTDDLRQALPPANRELWGGLRPNGTIDQLAVVIEYNSAAQQMDLDVLARKHATKQNPDGQTISLQPRWFPYRLDEVHGEAHYRAGELELRNVRAKHGRTEFRTGAKCSLKPDGGWAADFTRITADRIDLDHELLAALPERFGQAIGKANFTGSLNVDGTVRIVRDNARQPPRVYWDLTTDVENGSLDAGMKLSHLRGDIRFVGNHDGRQWQSQGEMNLDSLHHQQLHFTRIKGPLWLDESRIVFGSWAETAAGKKTARPLTAVLFGGQLNVDAQIATADDHRFSLESTVTAADMAAISAELTSHRKSLSGKVFAGIRLTGSNKGRHTLRGDGRVRLRDADIYQAPLMVALLNVINFRPPDSATFTNSDTDFRIQGEHVYLDRIDFSGDTLTVKGNGDVDLSGNLNINFYTMVGPDVPRASLVRNIFRAASQQFLLIHVGGSLEQPDVQRKAFPGLEETFQQLFPEARNRDANRVAAPPRY